MIDTHAHLYSEQFDGDRDEVIQRAIAANVTKFIVPSTDSDSFDSMKKLCDAYPDVCFPAAGLHPTSVKENFENELSFVEKRLSDGKFCAVGEIGVDCYWSTDFIEYQRIAFEYQINLAKKFDLPVIIHAREAFHEIFTILDRIFTPNIRGVFHSFSGTAADYFKIMEYGTFKIGVGGVVTFKNSNLPQIIESVPLTDIVLETDAPYLAPSPYRGKRNESSHIPLIAQKIAEIKKISLEDVDRITSETAQTLFVL
ncbi:MAG: TatD family hydrolase [Prevotellaceae bacterium]|jgi:TatD DNase family protein|nr:TatD family hydrolase [Prevotellaceae bacterium]